MTKKTAKTWTTKATHTAVAADAVGVLCELTGTFAEAMQAAVWFERRYPRAERIFVGRVDHVEEWHAARALRASVAA